MAAPKIAKDIRDYLVNTTGLTAVSIGALMQDPVNQYAVIAYPGKSNIKVHGTASGNVSVALDRSCIQILARHKTAQTALENIHAVIAALDGLMDVTINGTVYLYFSELNPPQLMDRDEAGSTTYGWELWCEARR